MKELSPVQHRATLRAAAKEIFVSSCYRQARQDLRYIFAISPGRAGSEYLARLLGTATRAEAYHEPWPTMTGQYLTKITSAPMQESFASRRAKEFGINFLCRNLPPGYTYVETSHMFIKTFWDVVLAAYRNVKIIHLQRSLDRVLKSFMEMRYFTPHNHHWPAWMVRPDAATAALPLFKPYANCDAYERCIAYLLDIEQRALRLSTSRPELPFYKIDIDDLNRVNNVHALMDELGLEPSEATSALCGNPVNVRSSPKLQYGHPVHLDECRRRIDRYLREAEAEGIVIPRGVVMKW